MRLELACIGLAARGHHHCWLPQPIGRIFGLGGHIAAIDVKNDGSERSHLVERSASLALVGLGVEHGRNDEARDMMLRPALQMGVDRAGKAGGDKLALAEHTLLRGALLADPEQRHDLPRLPIDIAIEHRHVFLGLRRVVHLAVGGNGRGVFGDSRKQLHAMPSR